MKVALTGRIAGTDDVAAANQTLRTGDIYENSDGVTVTPDGDGYRVDGTAYSADRLPLPSQIAVDGMWFACAGVYPEIPYVE